MPAIGDGARAQGGSMSARGGIYRGPGGEQLYGDGRQVESARPPEHQTQPYKVRASCGHIVIRRMRPATAGVPYTPEVVLDAPNGRACEHCEGGHPERAETR
jgi:hypothetical protein